MGTIPWDAPKETRFLPATTTTIPAPGLSGTASAAKVVVTMRMQTKPNWKIAQPNEVCVSQARSVFLKGWDKPMTIPQYE